MADVVIVLTEGMHADGSLTEGAKSRVETGVALYREHKAPFIAFCGKRWFLSSEELPWSLAEGMKRYAMQLGVPETDILCEEESTDTIGNIYFAKTLLLQPRHWHSCVIVTSDYHLERTMYICKKVLGVQYAWSLVGAPAPSQSGQIEPALLALTKRFLDALPDGDDAAMSQFLFTKHPGYTDDSAVKEELRLFLHSVSSRE